VTVNLYPQDTAERFEFPKVLRRVMEKCRSEKGKTIAAENPLSADPAWISTKLDETAEALEIVENGLYFPELSFPNIARELSALGVSNAVLEGRQAVNLMLVAETAGAIIRFLGEKKEEMPALKNVFGGLTSSRKPIQLIDAVVERNGFVKSSASRELANARKDLSDARQRVNRAFEAAVRKYKKLGWLRDFEETVYNDRRVLGVAAEHKRQIEGTLHGSSESGNTVFIEPANLVGLNNDVAEARQREQREEWKVLRRLTDDLRPFKDTFAAYEYALGMLDFTFAKAMYARSVGGRRPVMVKEKSVELVDAYHPLLLQQNTAEGKTTMPLSLGLDSKRRILLISGPNAGGKSVSLKTFGLLQIMFQSGLLIPAAEQSRMTVFGKLFVDIGDDQSIAYELSTYSSRLVKMKHFMRHADRNTLFFIDEFGTGSDPELGGAIAEAILEKLGDSGAFGVITTHYANLKFAAENHPHMVNGCMLFDEETLAPKYILDIGQAGSSYTFEVARKIGLHPEVIEAAKAKLDQRKVKLDRLLVTLQTKKNKLNKETSILEREKSNLRKEIESYRAESEKYREKRDDLNFGENKQLIEKGKKYDEIVRTWGDKKSRKEWSQKLELAARKEAAREKEKDLAEKLREKQERIRRQKANRKKAAKESKALNQTPVEVGDEVVIPGTKERGVVEALAKGKATVVFGMVKTIVPVDKLRKTK